MNHDLAHKTFHNILVIKPSSLGDVVRCLPILHGLRIRYPAARISWLIRPDCAPVLHHQPRLTLLPFDRRLLGRALHSPRAARELLSLLNSLYNNHFDLVLDLQGLFRSAFFSLVAAPARLGFAHAREFAPCFYTHRITLPRRPEHVVHSYYRFAHALGFDHIPLEFPLTPDPDALAEANNLLLYHQLSLESPFVVLLIGGTSAEKRWPAERFAQLAEEIHRRHHLPAVLLGAGPTERDAAHTLCRHTHAPVANLVDKSSLPQAIAILARARCVIGNDSGPLHLAAALGTPLLGLYGPTDPTVVGPFGQLHHVLQAGPNAPRTGRYSEHPDHKMTQITVPQAFTNLETHILSPQAT